MIQCKQTRHSSRTHHTALKLAGLLVDERRELDGIVVGKARFFDAGDRLQRCNHPSEPIVTPSSRHSVKVRANHHARRSFAGTLKTPKNIPSCIDPRMHSKLIHTPHQRFSSGTVHRGVGLPCNTKVWPIWLRTKVRQVLHPFPKSFTINVQAVYHSFLCHINRRLFSF